MLGKLMSWFEGGKPDPERQLAIINSRVNGAGRPLAKLLPGQLDPSGDGIYDCEDYAHDKEFAPDWPQGVTPQRYNAKLPDGQLHRVIVAGMPDGRQLVMDNLSNALLDKGEREHGGWQFTPYAPPALNMKAAPNVFANQASPTTSGAGNPFRGR